VVKHEAGPIYGAASGPKAPGSGPGHLVCSGVRISSPAYCVLNLIRVLLTMGTARAVERSKKPNSSKRAFKDKKPLHDLEEQHRLVLDNEGFAIVIAKRYQSLGTKFGLSFKDLKQECNLGFVIASQRWDPGRGIKFITYAGIWARKCIMDALNNKNPLYLPRNVRERVNALREALALIKENGDPSRLSKGAKKEYDEIMAGKESEESAEQKIEILERRIIRATQSNISLDQAMGDSERLPYEFLIGSEETMSDEIERKDLRRRLLKSMDALSNRERIIIENRFLTANPLTLKEVADMMGISPERVRQKQAFALKKLFSDLKEIKIEEKRIENDIPVEPKKKVEKIIEEKPSVSTKQNNPKPVNGVLFSTEELFVKKELELLSRFKNPKRKKLVYLENEGVPDYIVKDLDLSKIDLEKLILFVSVAKKYKAFECLKTSHILNNTTSAGFEGFVKWKKAEASQRSA